MRWCSVSEIIFDRALNVVVLKRHIQAISSLHHYQMAMYVLMFSYPSSAWMLPFHWETSFTSHRKASLWCFLVTKKAPVSLGSLVLSDKRPSHCTDDSFLLHWQASLLQGSFFLTQKRSSHWETLSLQRSFLPTGELYFHWEYSLSSGNGKCLSWDVSPHVNLFTTGTDLTMNEMLISNTKFPCLYYLLGELCKLYLKTSSCLQFFGSTIKIFRKVGF